MKKLYLAGPIFGTGDPYTWRRDMASRLPTGWKGINPLDIERHVEGGDPYRIVRADVEAIGECQALLALIDVPSWGTAMEIRIAYTKGIPVIGWQAKTGGEAVGPWLQVHCSLLTASFADVDKYLQELE